jgi:hypothetical protein
MGNKEVKELAEALIENERKNCTNCQEVNKDCWECEAEFIIKSGYHKVEPVQLEVLGDNECDERAVLTWSSVNKLTPYQAWAFGIKEGSQATIDQYKGQLFKAC